ncbi:hypothetical protein BGP_2914 [Beggiatoa sp. PS]|nr:hypothetical protein BGP_2914 [Beggiatoa sp. PS]
MKAFVIERNEVPLHRAIKSQKNKFLGEVQLTGSVYLENSHSTLSRVV